MAGQSHKNDETSQQEWWKTRRVWTGGNSNQ